MKTPVTILLAAVCLAASLVAQVPLIDRELFFGDPEISGAQISPDGKYIAFLKPLNKTRNVWLKRSAEPFSAAKPVTSDTARPISAYFWSRDGKYILYAQDRAGDENFNVLAVSAATALAASKPPEARNLTDAKGVRAMIWTVPRTDPDTLWIGLNDREKAWHDLYKVKISTGERTLVRKNTDRVIGWIFDNKDRLRLAARSDENGDTEILRVDPNGFAKIYSCTVFETCSPLRFDPENKRVYIMTNKGAPDLIRLALLDPETGKIEDVESDPAKRVDFSGAQFSELTDKLLATMYLDDRLRIYWKDKSFETDYNRLRKMLPGKEIRYASRTKDERLWLVTASSDTEPGETYLFDRKTKNATLQFRVREKLPREHLASVRPVRYKSSDGLEIPAYLTLPKGVPPKDLPAIVTPHGGPWGRDAWGYNSTAQFLANRGYAVLSPNFRGSTGYGKKFLDAGNREWGQKMQDDVTWGAKYLISEGIADPKRIGIMGGSYGGYATLAGVAFTPEVYAAAVDIVGPSNLITLLESVPPYWAPILKMFYERMGDPRTPEGKAQLERQSPLHSAAKIKTPLFVVQGANDPRVSKAESDQIVVALRDRGFPVEYLVAPDEGHGFARPVNSLAMMTAAEKFLAKHLRGRYQEGAPEEVASRLKEITVDPKTVVLANKVDARSIGVPKIEVAMRPGTFKYQASIAAAGQTIKLDVITTITEENGRLSVTETMKSPMGEGTNSAVLDKDTLAVRKRSVKQGPVVVEVTFERGKAAGSMKMGDKDTQVSADLGGELFADSAGAAQSIACLPLKVGYAATFRNFDFQKRKEKVMQLKVAAAESVTVPAGKFDAHKVEVSPADGGPERITMWIATDSRKAVKISAVMPQMNGATMTAELME